MTIRIGNHFTIFLQIEYKLYIKLIASIPSNRRESSDLNNIFNNVSMLLLCYYIFFISYSLPNEINFC